ncbi:SulP family inorganic anion transporter [Streptomyces sp. NPDC048290]|uniref:SulP family inorganic anion transporter n=1 Tax=Streptomyces sp. NPDC048290 TaxID=3155811 RepID=UPI00343046E3
MSAFRTLPQALETARAKGTRLVDSRRSRHAHQPHSPPPAGRHGRFRVAGADVSAAIAVFLIALPLSLGIALATGAPLQAGLVAAAVGGLVAGRLGGSALQVSGPAAGLTVVTADLIHRYGWRITCAITVLAGIAQLGLGCLRVARSALAVSPAIVHGMLAGIGVTIAVAQLHIVLGGTPQSAVLDNLAALPAQLAQLHPAAVSMSALTLALLFLWPRIPGRAGQLLRRIPAPLIAVAGATATASLAGIALPKVELPSWHSHALAGLPEGPALGLATAVLTTTLVCSVQSLLGAVAVDKLAAARPGLTAKVGRSDLDRELLGQGAANIASGALGGLPVAGVAVRSSANVNAGAVSRNSTMLHGVLVVVAALLMIPVLELIPLASLAALVMAVGIQMVSLNHIRTVTRHREVLVYAVTTLGVVLLGVLEGVTLGIAVAVAVALNRLARTRITHDEQEGAHHIQVRGQLTFLAVPRLSRALHHVPHGAHAVVELDGSFMDHAAYETLQDWRNTHTAQGGTVHLTGRRGPRLTGPTITPLLDLDSPTSGAGAGVGVGVAVGARSEGAGDAGGCGGSGGGGTGVAASTGSVGTAGAQSSGSAGSNGPARSNGFNGSDGSDGSDGFSGDPGITGTTGVAEVPGAGGIDAVAGAGRALGEGCAAGAVGVPGGAGTKGTMGEPEGAGREEALGVPGSAGIDGALRAGEVDGLVGSDAPIADCRCRPWTPWRNHQCEPTGSPWRGEDLEGAYTEGASAMSAVASESPGSVESAEWSGSVGLPGAGSRFGPGSPDRTAPDGTAPDPLAGPDRRTHGGGRRGGLTPSPAGAAGRDTGADGVTVALGADIGADAGVGTTGASARTGTKADAEASAGADPTGAGASTGNGTGTGTAADAGIGTGADTGATTATPAKDNSTAHTAPEPEPDPNTAPPPITQAHPPTAPTAPTSADPISPTASAPAPPTPHPPSSHQLARGISAFQRNTAPLVRGELARLAREGQRPSQLFLTCADSRVVTSMITSSGPGDLFVVRNVGNLVPLPGAESGDDSVAAAIEYAVDVLRVRSITVCGHSGCSGMQALLNAEPGGAMTPLRRWLRHGRPSLERMADAERPWPRLAGRRPADAVEQLCLTNVVQQLEHLRAHEAVAQALGAGALELHGMYFHVGEAQAYLLTERGEDRVFDDVEGADGLRSRA